VDAETVQLYYQIALQGREDLPLAPDEHAGFVMTVLRMLAFRPEGGRAEPAFVAGAGTPAAAPRRASAAQGVAGASSGEWPEMVSRLPITGAARELARHAELRRREGTLFELVLPKARAYLADRNYQEKLKAALEQYLGTAVAVKVQVGETTGATAAAVERSERDARQAAAVKAVREDDFVKDLVDLFDGTVVDSTIRTSRPGP
jgi:DNA polymerase III subunit gamma/tau